MSSYHPFFWKSKNIHSKLSNDVSNVIIRPLVTTEAYRRSSVCTEILPNSPFGLFLHIRKVIQDEFLSPIFFKIKKYTFRAFKWRVERYHTTSSHSFKDILTLPQNPPKSYIPTGIRSCTILSVLEVIINVGVNLCHKYRQEVWCRTYAINVVWKNVNPYLRRKRSGKYHDSMHKNDKILTLR